MPLKSSRLAGCSGLLFLLILSAGCTNRPVAVSPSAAEPRQVQVPLTILRSAGERTLAFVPIYIQDQGPFAFALDTGASHSLIDQELADRLGLPTDGTSVKLRGIATLATGRQVRINHWRIGDTPLPTRTLVTLNLNKHDGESDIKGLLGSDMLSHFGRVTIDYRNSLLTLDDPTAQVP